MKYLQLKHYRDGPREPAQVRGTSEWVVGSTCLPITDGPFVETTDLIAEHAYALSTTD